MYYIPLKETLLMVPSTTASFVCTGRYSTFFHVSTAVQAGADLGGGCRGFAPPPPPKMTCGFLIQLVFCQKKMWFIGVEVEQETSAPPPKKNPGSAPDKGNNLSSMTCHSSLSPGWRYSPSRLHCMCLIIKRRI